MLSISIKIEGPHPYFYTVCFLLHKSRDGLKRRRQLRFVLMAIVPPHIYQQSNGDGE